MLCESLLFILVGVCVEYHCFCPHFIWLLSMVSLSISLLLCFCILPCKGNQSESVKIQELRKTGRREERTVSVHMCETACVYMLGAFVYLFVCLFETGCLVVQTNLEFDTFLNLVCSWDDLIDPPASSS